MMSSLFILSLLIAATLLFEAQCSSDGGAAAFVSLPTIGIGGISSTEFQTEQPRRSATRISPSYDEARPTSLHASTGSGFGKKSSKPTKTASSPSSELFELQELRAQLQTILKDNILYQSLSPEKREELTKYVKAVVDKTDSPIDFSGKSGNTMGIAKFVAGVEQKSWRMVFSTDASSSSNEGGGGAGELPYGSTVVLRIGEFMGTEGTLDYVLKFSKQIMGLNELVAKSTCSVDVSTSSVQLCRCIYVLYSLCLYCIFYFL